MNTLLARMEMRPWQTHEWPGYMEDRIRLRVEERAASLESLVAEGKQRIEAQFDGVSEASDEECDRRDKLWSQAFAEQFEKCAARMEERLNKNANVFARAASRMEQRTNDLGAHIAAPGLSTSSIASCMSSSTCSTLCAAWICMRSPGSSRYWSRKLHHRSRRHFHGSAVRGVSVSLAGQVRDRGGAGRGACEARVDEERLAALERELCGFAWPGSGVSPTRSPHASRSISSIASRPARSSMRTLARHG